MKKKRKKVDNITCSDLSSLSYHRSGELTRQPSTILQATGGIMTHDSTLKSREYGVVLCESLSGNDLVRIRFRSTSHVTEPSK
jgi:hypothetical protein